jgi:hypothetical protein
MPGISIFYLCGTLPSLQFACHGIPFFAVGLNAYDLTEVALINNPEQPTSEHMVPLAAEVVGVGADEAVPSSNKGLSSSFSNSTPSVITIADSLVQAAGPLLPARVDYAGDSVRVEKWMCLMYFGIAAF